MINATQIAILASVKNMARAPYAWPGGYPLYLVTGDGAAICPACARREFAQIARESFDQSNCGFRAAAVDVNYEDSGLYCDHCNGQIESAYGADSDETESVQ